MSLTFKNLDAIRRAIAWAEANPDKIIAGTVAQDDDANDVSTLDPSATCFCLVGVVAREAGVDVRDTGSALATFVKDYPVDEDHETDILWETNDDGVYAGDSLRGFRNLKELIG